MGRCVAFYERFVGFCYSTPGSRYQHRYKIRIFGCNQRRRKHGNSWCVQLFIQYRMGRCVAFRERFVGFCDSTSGPGSRYGYKLRIFGCNQCRWKHCNSQCTFLFIQHRMGRCVAFYERFVGFCDSTPGSRYQHRYCFRKFSCNQFGRKHCNSRCTWLFGEHWVGRCVAFRERFVEFSDSTSGPGYRWRYEFRSSSCNQCRRKFCNSQCFWVFRGHGVGRCVAFRERFVEFCDSTSGPWTRRSYVFRNSSCNQRRWKFCNIRCI